MLRILFLSNVNHIETLELGHVQQQKKKEKKKSLSYFILNFQKVPVIETENVTMQNMIYFKGTFLTKFTTRTELL